MPDETKTPAPAASATEKKKTAVEDVLDSWWSDFLLSLGPSLSPNAHAQVVTLRENLKARVLGAL